MPPFLTDLTNSAFDYDKVYYQSGPMSGYPEFNYPYFIEVAEQLRDTGIKIESPHENEWPENHENLSEPQLWQAMMGKSMLQMTRCNGIILLQGWPQSRGAKRELEFAYAKDWPVYYYSNFMLTDMNKELAE